MIPTEDDAVGREGAAALCVRRRRTERDGEGRAGAGADSSETKSDGEAEEIVEPIEEVPTSTYYCSCRSFYELNKKHETDDAVDDGFRRGKKRKMNVEGGGENGDNSVIMCKHLLAARIAPALVSPSEPESYLQLEIVSDAKFASYVMDLTL
uniref:Uncharacterized protein n=1 Tax=Corethron hystrix TaxID=216773 RepID=A0A7S1BM98_9STRA